MSDNPSRFQRFFMPILPAIVTGVLAGGVSLLGINCQDRQSEKRIEADFNQMREKLKQDHDNLISTLQSADDQSQKARAKEFRLKYYERQMDFLSNLCQTAVRIAASRSLKDSQDDIDKFNQSLVAGIPLFGDDQLRELAIDFHREMMKQDREKPVPKEQFLILRNKAYRISVKCRDILKHTFNLDTDMFGDLPPDSLLLNQR